MASLALTRLMKNVRVHTPGAIDSVIQLELYNVLATFFSDTNIWREDINFSVLAADVQGTVYPIVSTAPSSIVRLIGIKNSDDIPVAGTMATAGAIILNNALGTAATLTATVSLTVDDPVDGEGYPEFPAWTLDKYFYCILDGVIARLMAQNAKPFTNLKLAAYRERLFKAAVGTVKGEVARMNLHNGQAWRFPQSFASTRR